MRIELMRTLMRRIDGWLDACMRPNASTAPGPTHQPYQPHPQNPQATTAAGSSEGAVPPTITTTVTTIVNAAAAGGKEAAEEGKSGGEGAAGGSRRRSRRMARRLLGGAGAFLSLSLPFLCFLRLFSRHPH